MQQGSLRQFILNANEITGADVMRFVPAITPDVVTGTFSDDGNYTNDGGDDWWRIAVTAAALPPITGANTTIDGTAYDKRDGVTVLDTNQGLLGTGGTVGTGADGRTGTGDETALGQVARPELEIRNTAAPLTSIGIGLDVNGANAVIQDLAILGFGTGVPPGAPIGNIVVRNVAGTVIQNNVIGTGAHDFVDPGAGARGAASGVLVDSGDNGTIQNNLIGFNGYAGVHAFSSADNWQILGNEIRGNGQLSNVYDGLNLNGMGGNTVVQGNLITGNLSPGIDVPAATGTMTIEGNTISNNAAGAGLEQSGITIRGGTATTTISHNVISGNTGSGVLIANTGTAWITQNSISGSTGAPGLGIDLVPGAATVGNGVTPNDAGDGDPGGNELQNNPVLTSASSNGATVTINGTFASNASSNYRLEFFASPTADPSGAGEGQMYLGSQLVSTDAAGNMIGGPFSYNFAVPIAPGWVVSATATNTGTGRTSEFSNAIGTATISGTIWEDVDGDSQLGDFVGRDGVTVRLYRDAAGGGAGAPDATDTLVGTVVTSGGGLYAFNNLADGTYWAIVDSRTFTRPVAQLASGAAGQDDIWAEQTYGVTGAMNGPASFLGAAGALFGGRNAAISDNAFSGASINAPEHVTQVAIAGANAAGVDSAFSFNAVVNVRGDTTDDDATAGALRVQQGSLRQFILNSNEIIGVQTSNFSIGGGGAKTIAPTAGFASITDAVVLDATTQEGFAGTPLIELDGTGAGGATGLTLASNGSTVRGFVINRFSNGIRISGDNNLVAGNWIGLDATGSLDRGNGTDGIILVAGAADNTIGGTTANDRNVISGNNDDGISIDGASGTIVIGNYIGTDAQGTAAVGNSGDGVAIQLDNGVTPTTNTIVGGTSAAERNVISGNAANSAQGLANVRIRGAGTTGNVVLGNYIGTDYTGGVALANPRDGIVIDEGALNNTIGGAVSGAGNVISGSTNNGIRIQGTYSYAAGDVLATIYGNRIGTNAAGTAALANGQSGIFVDGSSGTAVTAPQRIAIGGTGANQGNTIAFNTQDGVAVTVNASRVTIVGNSIYSNGSTAGDLGIDLAADGVTNNDGTGPYDGDNGPNTLQNFPAFSAVTTDGTTLTVSGRLDSIASTTYTIHFYASTAIDASSHGEGQRYLGSTTVLTNASGTVLFNSVPISAVVAPGEWVSMTATDPSGNTSEFSVSVAANTPPVNTVPGAQSIPEDTTQAIAGISVGDAETNVNSLQLAVSNGILNVAAAGGAGVAGNGTVSVVITGTQAAINATVASLTYRGSLNYTGPDTLTVTTTDAGSLTDVDTVAITVNPVDDAPVNSVPAAQSTNEDTPLVFSAGNGNLVSISDLDAGVASVQVQLTVTNGTLTLSGTAGLTLVAGGSGTATMTYTGTIASWNAAMAGMSYAPTANYNGAATLTIVTNDLGNSGSGGPLTDADVVNITVNPLNDAPVALNDGYTVAEDSTLTVGWWDTDWSRRQQITFNNTNVGGFAPAETLSSFPVLLVLNSTNVDYSLTQDDGGDLRFFDGDGAPLAYEIERWDETGNSYVWVRVPQIDIGATDWITMYYSNASVADGEDSSAVWAGTGYRSVYHLDDVGPTVQDATSTSYDGTATNGATGGQIGQIGSAYGFDAADDYINLGDDRSFIDGASAATFSAWVRLNDNDGINPNIILSASINSGGAPSGTSRMAIELDPFGDVKFIVRSDDSAVTTVFTSGTPVTAGDMALHHGRRRCRHRRGHSLCRRRRAFDYRRPLHAARNRVPEQPLGEHVDWLER